MVVVMVVIVVVSVSPRLFHAGTTLLAKAVAARGRSERDAFIVAFQQQR